MKVKGGLVPPFFRVLELVIECYCSYLPKVSFSVSTWRVVR